MNMTVSLSLVLDLTAGSKPDTPALIAALDAAVETLTSGTATIKAVAINIQEK